MLVKPYDAARHTTGVTGGVATVTRQQASARGVYAVRMHHAAINAGAVVAHVCFICSIGVGCIRVAYHSVRCCVTYVCVLEWYVSQLYESSIFRASLGRALQSVAINVESHLCKAL